MARAWGLSWVGSGLVGVGARSGQQQQPGSLRLTLLALACCADCVQWPSESRLKQGPLDRSISRSGGGSARFRSRLLMLSRSPTTSVVGGSLVSRLDALAERREAKSCARVKRARSLRNETNGATLDIEMRLGAASDDFFQSTSADLVLERACCWLPDPTTHHFDAHTLLCIRGPASSLPTPPTTKPAFCLAAHLSRYARVGGVGRQIDRSMAGHGGPLTRRQASWRCLGRRPRTEGCPGRSAIDLMQSYAGMGLRSCLPVRGLSDRHDSRAMGRGPNRRPRPK